MVECSVDRRVRRSEDTYIARTKVPAGAETIDFGRYMGNLARQVASAHQTRPGAFAQGHRVRIAAPVFVAEIVDGFRSGTGHGGTTAALSDLDRRSQ